MMQRIGMAIGAGLAAALLFAVMAKGTFLAVTLAYLAPLPIVIVTLGWGLDMGGLAVVVAGAVGAALLGPLSDAPGTRIRLLACSGFPRLAAP